MHLGELKPGPRKKGKRVGRGNGSGLGKTCGRGGKGQTARTGGKIAAKFEGGQMPFYRRIPLRGFNNYNFRDEYQAVNVQDLSKFSPQTEVSLKLLVEKGMIKKECGLLKILGQGELKIPLKVQANKFSKSAVEKIKAAGGEAIII